jgi:trehalose monomycolate/heme transporter
MFARWGNLVVRGRWIVLAAALVLVLLGGTWGAGVFHAVSGGGFNDPNSASNRVRQQVTRELGVQDTDVLALYSSSTLSVDDPAFQSAVSMTLAAVRTRHQVATIVSYYDTKAPALVSRDRHATYVMIILRPGSDEQKLADYRAIEGDLAAGGGLTTQLGGTRPFYDQSQDMTARDIERAEVVSLPIVLVLLVIIFGSLVAAMSPLLIGGIAILGAFLVTRLLTYATDVSTFAINIITLIGLGLSVDYALFVVSRFREELAAGRPVPEAVSRTLATAGRTVAVSGVTVTLALASLQLFPQGFLKSMSYGGMAAVVVAMLASLTVLPAWLAVLGPRVNAVRLPNPFRRGRHRPDRVGLSDGAGAWARLAHSVMRRPWAYLVGVLVILAVLATPVTRIAFGGVDTRILPASTQSRIVSDRIGAEFPRTTTYPIEVLATGVDQTQAARLAQRLRAIPGATVTPAASQGDAALFQVGYTGEPTDGTAREMVGRIRALRPDPGTTIGVTGYTADLIDQLDELGAKLPWMVLFVVVVTLVLLFAAFGSVVLPVKAVLMNVVSLGAAFGVVVFIFQEGHFASWLGYTSTGYLEPNNPILMIAVLFGLATDYEVFLLSRVREEWDRTGDNTASVAMGLQRTGRIITSAALLLIVVIIGFATGQIGFVKMIGVGMIVAIFVDATLVRALLVPATMRLLGRWNWWAPGPLGRLYRRYGLREESTGRELVLSSVALPAARLPSNRSPASEGEPGSAVNVDRS